MVGESPFLGLTLELQTPKLVYAPKAIVIFGDFFFGSFRVVRSIFRVGTSGVGASAIRRAAI